jgi:hypothetical protein
MNPILGPTSNFFCTRFGRVDVANISRPTRPETPAAGHRVVREVQHAGRCSAGFGGPHAQDRRAVGVSRV